MKTITISQDFLSSLRVSDSAFPGGNFGFSNGMEAVLGSFSSVDETTLTDIICDFIENRWKTSDCNILRKCFTVKHDLRKISEIDRELDQSSTSSVAREGSINNGRALLGTASTLGVLSAQKYLALIREEKAIGHIPIAQSLYWSSIGIDESQAVHMSFYSTVSNYCQVAVRLGAVGAIQAQRIMTFLIQNITLDDSTNFWKESPSSFTPFSDISTLKLSQEELRLFRN